MQGSSLKHVRSIETEISDLEGYFSRKVSENGQKIEKLTILRAITLCKKNLGVAAYAGELPTICTNHFKFLRKCKTFKNFGKKFTPHTFSNAVESGVR